jgi:hypothetical protein
VEHGAVLVVALELSPSPKVWRGFGLKLVPKFAS